MNKSDKLFRVEYKKYGEAGYYTYKQYFNNLDKAKARGLKLLSSDTIEAVQIEIVPLYSYDKQIIS